MQIATTNLTMFIVIGAAAAILIYAWFERGVSLFVKHVLLFAVLISVLAIAGFYANLPNVITKVYNAPINLSAPTGYESVKLKN